MAARACLAECGFLVLGDENLALAGVVGGADDALLLHLLDNRGGAIVADRQTALDVAGRGLAVAQNDGNGAVVEVVRFVVAVDEAVGAGLAALGVGVNGNGGEILRRALRLQVRDDLLDFLVRDKRTVFILPRVFAKETRKKWICEVWR